MQKAQTFLEGSSYILSQLNIKMMIKPQSMRFVRENFDCTLLSAGS